MPVKTRNSLICKALRPGFPFSGICALPAPLLNKERRPPGVIARRPMLFCGAELLWSHNDLRLASALPVLGDNDLLVYLLLELTHMGNNAYQAVVIGEGGQGFHCLSKGILIE